MSLVTLGGEIVGDGDTVLLDLASLGLGGVLALAFENRGNDTAINLVTAFEADLDRIEVEFLDEDAIEGSVLLPPGVGGTFLLRVDPRDVGEQLDSILVGYTTIGGGELLTVYLRYEAVLPELSVGLTANAAGLASGATLDFTGTPVGRDSTRSLFLRNAAAGAIAVDSISLATGTAFSFEELALPVLMDNIEELRVTFSPDSVGSFSDTLTILTSLPGRDSVFRVVLTATTTVGIADLGLGTAAVFPNPVLDLVTVELAEAITGGEWQITNAAGQVVSRGLWPDNMQRHQIDMQVLPKGAYLLRVRSGDRGMAVQLVR